MQKSMNGLVNEVLMSIVEFPLKVRVVANWLSPCDDGPFPVSHRDFFIATLSSTTDIGYLVLLIRKG